MTHPSLAKRDPKTGIPLSWLRRRAQQLIEEENLSAMSASLRARRDLEADWSRLELLPPAETKKKF